MAKRKPGPKEAELRNMREGKAGTAELDPAEIMLQIETEEAELEAKRKAIREKHTAALKQRIQELQQQRREIDQQLNELNEIEAKILGTAVIRPKGGGGKRRRLNESQKMELAKVIYSQLAKSKGNEFARKDLESFADGVQIRELVELWNGKGAENNGQKIKVSGERALTRYSLPA